MEGESARKDAILFIVSSILAGDYDIRSLKRQACKEHRLVSFIRNTEILALFPPDRLNPQIIALLRKKPVKTLSGVTPVAVMIKPEGSCTHSCIYCPAAGLAPKSYTGFEPAARRGRQYAFDPYAQAAGRVRQFEEGGHPADKCEVIVMGGTFLETNPEYRVSFIKGVYDGLNGFCSDTLAEAEEANEAARHRVVGLTIETRPDVCASHIQEMLSYGATRVELGVQHADDSIYRTVKRGHTVQDVADATRELKDAAFKVLYHVMPGLPGSDRKKDIAFVKRLFEDERFCPDMLKIYPALVIGGTGLERWYGEGSFTPYTSEEAADVISEMYRYIPKYVRVMRIQRDIPLQKIVAGVSNGNLRELVDAKMGEKGIIPEEIRSREIGLNSRNSGDGKDRGSRKGTAADLSGFHIRRLDYKASGGQESFISYENGDGIIAGFIRLRMHGASEGAAFIRELHVYGQEASLEQAPEGDAGCEAGAQHKGLGANLLREAEGIARTAGMERMLIISGVGARGYYRKHGYERTGPYMGKTL
jgi:elongator complex protein 3